MKRLFLLAILTIATLSISAQRKTDMLDRGLIAIQTTSGVYCSWRIMGEEYYDVTYNLYRDGVKIADQLNVSNFTDAAGTSASKYTVKAVVRGAEQAASKAASVWAQNYLEITPTHADLLSVYVPNDACCADVTGDGQLEILMKFDNQSEIEQSYPKNGPKINGVDTKEYSLFECLKLDGTRLWWVNCGPNMGDFQNNEQNIVAYDWDGDGKAEAIFRAADGTTIHDAFGTPHVIGDASKNYRAATGGGTNWFMHDGAEYLVYVNGETGVPYQIIEYPLKRLESGETNLEKAWGDGYGHRSTKHFFGAPYLDGRKPSIFLARGIYTRHKMIALDVNPTTHELTERWRWNCNDASSPWYGNGYHNYAIADVDWDGRDEICFGSMVIDDNGKGLSTTGYGHGDAQHHGDFNPYIHGQEIFACLEDSPYWGDNYRDGTTAKIYRKFTSGHDDGRCIAGNFSNDYPGAMAFSGDDKSPISCVTADYIPGLEKGGIPDNFRIYWDGDLCEEGFNGTGTVSGGTYHPAAGAIFKYKKGNIETLTGSITNNYTKATPCYQGDLFGDWREEVMMRTADNKIRIYSTTIPTEWRNYTLWHDMQYRNAMVWQMCGYNQPPHVSYFLGELEGITAAPPALTNTNRTEIDNGGSISTSMNDKQVMLAATSDATVTVASGASPYIFFDNAPSWVQGTDVNGTSGKDAEIIYDYYTHTLTGGAFSGAMRLVKQGDGTLELPNVTETYTGNTDIWAGTLRFNGTMQNSPLWLNRHANLESAGQFLKGVKADYNSAIYVGGKNQVGNLSISNLTLGFGARLVVDVYADGSCDKLSVTTLELEKKDWQNGPVYSTPVLELVPHYAAGKTSLDEGTYEIATIGNADAVDLTKFVVEGLSAQKATLKIESGKILVIIEGMRDPGAVTWTGEVSNVWDMAVTENFSSTGSGLKDVFVTGDVVTFDDNATVSDVNLQKDVYPSEVIFNNNMKNYTLSGAALAGEMKLTKNGAGKATITTSNSYKGHTYINNGTLEVTKLADGEGVINGALGIKDNYIYLEEGGTLSVTATTGVAHAMRSRGGTMNVANGATVTMKKAIVGDGTFTKTGTGQLNIAGSNKIARFEITEGTVYDEADGHSTGALVVFNGKSAILKYQDSQYSYSSNNSNFLVEEGCTGTIYLDGRCDYKGTLTGDGVLSVYAVFSRHPLKGDWSGFNGTLKAYQQSKGMFTFCNANGLPGATLDIQAGCTFLNKDDQSNKYYQNLKIGALSGSGTLGGQGTYYIGTNNKSTSFSGIIGSGINIVKQGSGKWTISKEQTQMGTLSLEGGQIELRKNTTTTMTGESPLTAKNGTLLSGFGCLGNSEVKFESGSTLNPGVSGNTTTMTLSFYGDVTMMSGSVLKLDIYNWKINDTRTLKKNSQLNFAGGFEVNGEIEIAIPSDERYPLAFAAGDEFTFWTGTITGKPTIKLGVLPAGLKWDSSKLLSEGKLVVVDDPAGIEGVDIDRIAEYKVTSSAGILVLQSYGTLKDVKRKMMGMNLPSGIYVITVNNNNSIKIAL